MNAIIVTGGTRGIGKAIVDAIADRLLARDPDLGAARLVATYRSGTAGAQALGAGLQARGIAVDVQALDLASGASIDAFVGHVRERYGAVRALVNNAGSTYDGAFLTMSDDAIGALIESNLSGTIRLTETLLPLLKAARPAAVVSIASAAGVYGKGGQVPYATTKGGLIGYTQLLARRCAGQDIFVNAVAPGFIATDMVAKLDPIMYEPILHNASLRKMGQPQDVAHVVCGLLKPGYVQATTIKVDGGHLR